MPVVKKMIFILTIFSFSAICWVGCSDGTIVRFVDNSGATTQAEPVESYFPLNAGYTTIYNVTYSSGGSEQVTFRAGHTVSFQGIEAMEWIGSSSNTLDTGYFYASNNTLYYYASKSAVPEKILQLPLSNGASWRTNDINSNDFTDIITSTDTTNNDDINAKIFPTITAVNFTVETTEAVNLETGEYYSSAVRISTPNGSRKNYYWYAQGIGLVRYAIGASTSSYPNGDIVGEIVDSGY